MSCSISMVLHLNLKLKQIENEKNKYIYIYIYIYIFIQSYVGRRATTISSGIRQDRKPLPTNTYISNIARYLPPPKNI